MMKRFLIRSVVGLLALISIVVVYVAITLVRASGGLPQWDGTVEVAGLNGAVEIVRDQDGIPFIQADSERDLYFAQGFVHAQDRFWQMALSRQATEGRLAEWLGGMGLLSDRIARMYGWSHLAQDSLEALADDDRDLLEAYAAGVNAWLESPAFRHPPEMVILHIQPERWKASDAFLAIYQVHRTLSSSGLESIRAVSENTDSPPSAVEMFDKNVLMAPPIIAPTGDESVLQPTAPFKDRAFSNNWTLSGDHTASGKPLMANDPHLPQTTPGFWQLQHHTVEGRIAAGGSLPGLPGIIVGHNSSLAWGITTALIDVRDFAYVEVHPENPDRYRRSQNEPWQDFDLRVEKIHVRFGKDLTETIRSTTQGVSTPRNLGNFGLFDREGLALEVRDVATDQVSTSPVAFLRLHRAGTVDEGIQAGEAVTSPAMNVSLADTNGAIGYVATGRIPLRPEEHAQTVDLDPADGNERTYLPYLENPRVVNPTSGRIVTANQQIIGEEYPYYLTDRWAAPYRAWRIHELLDQQKIHDVDSFRTMQMDSLSPVARELIPFLMETQPADEADARLMDILRAWDYRFTLDAPAPVAWLTWVEFLNQRVVADDRSAMPTRWGALLYSPLARALGGEHPEWCDDLGTSAVEVCADALRSSLTDARLALEDAFGPDPQGWKWGEVASFRLPHLGFAGLPILDGMFSRYTPLPGGPESNFTNAVNLLEAPVFSSTSFTPSYQAIYDLSDLDSSLFMILGGSSGHFRSPYYDNLTDDWIAGERIELSPANVSPIATLTLVPDKPRN
jgi:penicillin amidase